ncbi:MAG: hypothetical protein ABI995_02670 [Acidobacteriota bacterium]
MSDKDLKQTSLDDVLQKHLGRVSAPEQLWHRVQHADKSSMKSGRASSGMRFGPMFAAWQMAAAATVAISVGGWMLWQAQRTTVSVLTVEEQAVAALEQSPRELPLHTEDALEVRTWVKANSGIDIPLPPKHSPLVRILGATVTQDGDPVAAVSYEVGAYRAALMVTKDPSGATTYPKHDLRGSDPFQAARVTSWSMKGQSYTLAFSAPGESKVACLLCHGQEPAMGSSPSLMN